MTRSRSRSLSAALTNMGVRCVFGLPGTQNVELFEELRTSSLRTVLATSELAAAFMAVGYARASGRPGVLVTIPGPGFTYALPGLAEARLDSVPLIHIVVHKPLPPGRRFRHQEIQHQEIVRPLVKEVVEVRAAEGVPVAAERAWRMAQEGEPGPVVLWVSSEVFTGVAGKGSGESASESPPLGGEMGPAEAAAWEPGRGTMPPDSTISLAPRLSLARRPILFLGLGAVERAEQVHHLAERLGAPFFTTPSARGVIPEDHSLCLGFDPDRGGVGALNELLASSDLVLALGCKLGHNGTAGFRLKLPADRLVHVNTDAEALGANYPASLLIRARVEDVVGHLLESLPGEGPLSGWSQDEIALWRSRIAGEAPGGPPEPSAPGVPSKTVRELVQVLREEIPRDAILVTDSGLHQVMIRRHFSVLTPRGLIMPTDFQSMGFGLPAAIGAKLAAPERPVVAVIGDGGLAMSGMDLLTLARERLPVTVIVFNDGYLNLIRLQQERDFGHAHAVRLRNPDMEVLAEACGLAFIRLDSDVRSRIREGLEGGAPILAEVPLGESREIRSVRRTTRVKSLARQALGRRFVDRVKRLLGRD